MIKDKKGIAVYDDIPNEDFDNESPRRMVRQQDHVYEKDIYDDELDSNDNLESKAEQKIVPFHDFWLSLLDS